MAIPQKKFFTDRHIPLIEVSRKINRSQAYVYQVLNGGIRPARPTIEKLDALIEEIRQAENGGA